MEIPVIPFRCAFFIRCVSRSLRISQLLDSTECRHVFCGKCLAESFHSNGNNCPECRTVCGAEPKRDFALRGVIRFLYTHQGREEPTPASVGFDVDIFADMYSRERERQRAAERARLSMQVVPVSMYLVMNAAAADNMVYQMEVNHDVIDVDAILGTGAEVVHAGGGDGVEL